MRPSNIVTPMGNYLSPLEARRLLAVAVDHVNFVLHVRGTDAGEEIVVQADDAGRIGVTVDGVDIYLRHVAASTRAIMIDAGPGGDTVRLLNTPVGGYVLGGDGNDTLWGSDRTDNLVGAAGDDVIHGMAGEAAEVLLRRVQPECRVLAARGA